jgi:ThiF family
MDKQSWYDERDDRLLRYPDAHRLDPHRWIAITADASYLARPDGQAAALTACNLLSRMSPSIAIAFEDVLIHPSMPWAEQSLHAIALAQMQGADLHGQFHVRGSRATDFRFHLGRAGGTINVHGSGWNAWFGTGVSPMPDGEESNGTGSCLAVILAASQVFVHSFSDHQDAFVANALNWRTELVSQAPLLGYPINLGSVWTLGVGSVGSAALYFLTLATRNFDPILIDMDRIKLYNITRSPIFTHRRIRDLKVDVTKDFLLGAALPRVRTDDKPIDESLLWLNRQSGEADVVIAAANERQARYHIEARFPPVQIYATTGGNWQTTLFRHVPGAKSCSLCQFPKDQAFAATACATAPDLVPPANNDEQVDASLPFLSFAAGMMTAAEILKLRLTGYPFNADRVFMYTRPEISLFARDLAHRHGCLCEDRDKNVHRQMNLGSQYDILSRT